MEKTVKRSVITLNSQFRDHVKYPNSSDYVTTIPGFLNTGPPSFYGVESVGLLDATVVEHLDHGPVSQHNCLGTFLLQYLLTIPF